LGDSPRRDAVDRAGLQEFRCVALGRCRSELAESFTSDQIVTQAQCLAEQARQVARSAQRRVDHDACCLQPGEDPLLGFHDIDGVEQRGPVGDVAAAQECFGGRQSPVAGGPLRDGDAQAAAGEGFSCRVDLPLQVCQRR
jgi:hypothetical protein